MSTSNPPLLARLPKAPRHGSRCAASPGWNTGSAMHNACVFAAPAEADASRDVVGLAVPLVLFLLWALADTLTYHAPVLP